MAHTRQWMLLLVLGGCMVWSGADAGNGSKNGKSGGHAAAPGADKAIILQNQGPGSKGAQHGIILQNNGPAAKGAQHGIILQNNAPGTKGAEHGIILQKGSSAPAG